LSLLKRFPFLEPLPAAVEAVVGEPPPRGVEVLVSDDAVVSKGLSVLSSLSRGEYPWSSSDSIEDALASSTVFFLAAALAGGSVSARLLEELGRRVAEEVEGLDARLLVEALGYAGVRVERGGLSVPWYESQGGVVPLLLQWRVHVARFLSVAAGGDEPILALSNQFLLSGWVYMDVARLRALAVRALRLAAKKRLEEAEEIVRDLRSLDSLQRLAMLARIKLGGDRLPYRREALPPCVARILGKVETGRGVSDEEAYTLLTFLARLETPEEDVERIAELLGLKGEQLRRMLDAASRYPVPPCSKLAEAGICRCRGSLLEAYRRRLEEALSTLASPANP